MRILQSAQQYFFQRTNQMEEEPQQRFQMSQEANVRYRKDKQKELSQIEEDYNKMPQGSYIKVLQKNIKFAFQNKYNFLHNGDTNIIEVKQILQILEKNNCASKTIKQDLKWINEHLIDTDKIYYTLLKIRGQLFPLYVPKLQKIINKNQKAEQQVSGKQLILLIGKTGVGKSTIIFKCLGYQLVERFLKIGDLSLRTIEPKQEIKSQHQQIRCSPQQKSITSTITALQLYEYYQQGGRDDKLYVTDTPGLQDSSGCEVDIANGIGIINTVKKCHSVRPVVIISQQSWGDRSQYIKQLGKVIVGLFKNYQKIRKHVTWVFNKFSIQQINALPGKCQSIQQTLNQSEMGDIQFMQFVKDLKIQGKNPTKIIKFNPFASKKQFKDQFIDKIKAAIQTPGQHFQYNFSEKTKQALRSTCQIYESLIQKRFNQEKYQQAFYYLKHLKFLNDKINNNYATQSYLRICKSLETILNKTKAKIEMLLRLVLDNPSEYTYGQIFNERQKINKINKIRQIKFEDFQAINIPKQNQINQLFIKIQQTFLEKIQTKQSQILKQIVKGAKMYYQKCKSEQFKRKIKLSLENKITQIKNNMNEALRMDDYTNIKINYQKYVIGRQALTMIDERENQVNVYTQQIEDKLMEKINKLKNSVRITLQKDLQKLSIQDNQIQKINQTFKILDGLIKINLPFLNGLNHIRSDLQQQILKIVTQTSQKISQTLDKQQDTHKIIHRTVTQLDNSRKNINKLKQIKINQISKRIQSQINKLQSILTQFLNRCKQNAITIINAFKNQQKHVIEQKILSIDRTIGRLYNLLKYQTNQKTQQQIQSLIKQTSQQIGEYFKGFFINLSQRPKMQTLIKKFTQINVLKRAKDRLTILKNQDIDQAYQQIQKLLIKPIKQILKDLIHQQDGNIKTDLNYKIIQPKLQKYNNFAHYVTAINDQVQDFYKIIQNDQQRIKLAFKQIFNNAKAERTQLLNYINEKYKTENLNQIKKFKQNLNFYNRLITKQQFCIYVFEDDYQIQKIQKNEVLDKIIQIRNQFEQLVSTKIGRAGRLQLQNAISNCTVLKQLDSQLQSKQITFTNILRNLNQQTAKDYERCLDNTLNAINTTNPQQLSVDFQQIIHQWNNIGGNSNPNSQNFKRQINFKLKQYQNLLKNNYNQLAQNLIDYIPPQKAKNYFIQASNVIHQIKELKEKHGLEIESIINEDTIIQQLENILYEQYQNIKKLIQQFKIKQLKIKITQLSLIEKAILKLGKNQNKSKQLWKLLQLKQRQIQQKYLCNDYLKIKFDQYLIIVYQNLMKDRKQTFKKNLLKYFSHVFSPYQKEYQGNDYNTSIPLKQIANKIKSLPAQFRKQYQKKFINLKNQIQIKQRRYLSSIVNGQIQIINENGLEQQSKKIISLLNLHKNNKYLRQRFKYVLQKYYEFIKNDQNISFKIKLFKKYLQIYQNIKQKIENILQYNHPYLQKQSLIIKLFQEKINQLLLKFQLSYKNKEKNNIQKILQQLLMVGINIINLSNKFYNPSKDNQINNINSKFVDFITKNVNKFYQSFTIIKQNKLNNEYYNFNQINQILKIMNEFNVTNLIFNKIKNQIIENRETFQQQIIEKVTQLSKKNNILESLFNDVEDLIKSVQNFEFYNSDIKNYIPQEFKDHSNKLNHKLIKLQKILKSYQFLINHKRYEYSQLINNIQNKATRTIEQCKIQIQNGFQNYSQPISQKCNVVMKFMQTINEIGCIGIRFHQKIKDLSKIIEENVQQLKGKIQELIQQFNRIRQQQQKNQILRKISLAFIIFQKVSNELEYKSNQNKKLLEKLVQNFKKKINLKIIRKIRQIIENLPQKKYPQMLLSENSIFSIYSALQWKEDVKLKDIDQVIPQLGLDQQSSKKIKDSYQTYEQCFKKVTQQCSKCSKDQIDQIIDSLVMRTIHLGNLLSGFYLKNGPPIKGEKQQLLAYIFALWTILKSEKDQDLVKYLYQPHSVQIVTLFLLLGLNNKDLVNQKLANRMAEVGTGEGKSVILAGLSAYFSLVGYQVRCACYSQYLSNRDNQAFAQLFERLSLTSKIKYGTFNDQCWDLLNSIASSSNQGKGKNFGDLIKQTLLRQQSYWQKFKGLFGKNFLKFNNINNSKKILIIDQVDVFFDKSFYGNVLASCVSLTGDQVRNVLEMIWKRIKNGQQLKSENIIQSNQFKALIQKYKPLTQILENQVNGMIMGAYNHQHSYIINNQRIVYKDQDSISTTMNFGYKTVFANCYEYQQKTITREAYLESMEISLTVAQFSYALLPNYFDKIVGVTGTLFDIGQFYKRQLKDRYKVNDQYRMPSIYGQKIRVQDYKIVSNNQSYRELVTDIENKKNNQRPIICFFRNISDITDFYHSDQFKPYKQNANTLSELNDAYTRNSRIKQATKAGQVTLMTASFGRGTDFKLYDKTIAERGGLHIIQCYLSLELSQQIQVKGRSARQGKQGSYNLIISQEQFEKIGFGKYQNGLRLNDHVKQHRQINMDEVVKSVINQLQLAEKKHSKTVNLFETQNLTKQNIVQFLYEINMYPEVSQTENRKKYRQK